jgi:hypothetical protein
MGPFHLGTHLEPHRAKGQRPQVSPKGYFLAQWENKKVGDIVFHISFKDGQVKKKL